MKLREFLHEKGMKINFLAEHLGVNQSLVSAWMNGVGMPTLKYVIMIEEFTKGKVKAKDLLVENTRKTRQSKNKEQQQQQKNIASPDLQKFPEKPFS